MNRKFVKENKKVLREFLGKAIVNFFTNQGKKEIARMIDNDPELRKVRSSLIKNTNDKLDDESWSEIPILDIELVKEKKIVEKL